ncbi:MAG: hypothetical protein ACXWV0_01165 [Flavisolibacter sp.]
MPTNHFICMKDASALTSRFRQMRETLLDPNYQGMNVLPTCETFDRSAFDHVLQQDGCVGIRVYMGMEENNQLVFVLVGVNENDEDMITATENSDNEDEVFENGVRCPIYCPPNSPLNT